MFIAEDNGIVILGSDKRGTIYGIYELSRQLGVSPWYWMADAPIARHSEVWVKLDAAPGKHNLKIVMIDPEIVVEQVVVNSDNSHYSYFGANRVLEQHSTSARPAQTNP